VAEYLQLYPDAKVILSVRDSATEWAESFQVIQNLIMTLEEPFSWTYPNWIPLVMAEKTVNNHKIRCHLGTNTLNLDPCELIYGLGRDLEFLKQHYEKHNRRIREIVPPEQLLEFNVKEGWKPLCNFLGHDVPERDFPWRSKARQFKGGANFCKATTYLWIPALLSMVLMILKRGYGLIRGETKSAGETKLKQS
jgi:Sulfotransferase domain